MAKTRRTTSEEARRIGDEIGVDLERMEAEAEREWAAKKS